MDFELGSCVATIAGTRLKNVSKSLEDLNDWDSIEKLIEKYMKDRVKNIRVEYVVNYIKKRKERIMESQVIDDNAESDDDNTDSPQIKKRKVARCYYQLIVDTNRCFD